MNVESLVAQRMQALVEKGKSIPDDNNSTKRAWISAALRVCTLIWPPDEIYVERLRFLTSAIQSGVSSATLSDYLEEALVLLDHAAADIEHGLVNSFLNKARAEVFDELLDQADYYLSVSNKQGSGALASAVFEDCVRRVARAREIQEKDVKSDELISRLQKDGTLSPVKAARCRAAASVRNKALHARWDEFDLDDVHSTIALSRQLILEHLDRRV